MGKGVYLMGVILIVMGLGCQGAYDVQEQTFVPKGVAPSKTSEPGPGISQEMVANSLDEMETELTDSLYHELKTLRIMELRAKLEEEMARKKERLAKIDQEHIARVIKRYKEQMDKLETLGSIETGRPKETKTRWENILERLNRLKEIIKEHRERMSVVDLPQDRVGPEKQPPTIPSGEETGETGETNGSEEKPAERPPEKVEEPPTDQAPKGADDETDRLKAKAIEALEEMGELIESLERPPVEVPEEVQPPEEVGPEKPEGPEAPKEVPEGPQKTEKPAEQKPPILYEERYKEILERIKAALEKFGPSE
jgi:hypothetical protein